MTEKVQICDWCGASWQLQWKCQIICPNCGAKQDCSDLFVDYDEIQRQREARGLDLPEPTQTTWIDAKHSVK
ncbi:MAG: hypothetical protein F9K46_04875 [Anaerolineae bacterium]|nr:MAG: hypothetical protein F9K46_04875 [Anaerolineae bacterium]